MYVYNAKCTRVVDGDTIDAQIDLGFDVHKKIRIRMVGINTPESRTRDLEELWRYHPDNPDKKDVVKEYNILKEIQKDIESELAELEK